MTKRAIIADSGPLISLAIIGRLDLLKQLYQQVLIPPAVWDEVTVKGKGMPGADAVARLTWLEIRKPEPQVLQPLSILVDPGEAEVIALAQSVTDSIVLLDDSQARRVAERFDIPRIGTLGILRRAKKQGLITFIRPYIEELQSNNIYMSGKLIEAILQDVGE
jgi:predicted nucleic acid-binding protein